MGSDNGCTAPSSQLLAVRSVWGGRHHKRCILFILEWHDCAESNNKSWISFSSQGLWEFKADSSAVISVVTQSYWRLATKLALPFALAPKTRCELERARVPFHKFKSIAEIIEYSRHKHSFAKYMHACDVVCLPRWMSFSIPQMQMRNVWKSLRIRLKIQSASL